MKANLHDQFLEGWAGVIPPGYSATLAEKAVGRIRSDFSGWRVEDAVVYGSPSGALILKADEWGADLVLRQNSIRPGFSTTSQAALRNAKQRQKQSTKDLSAPMNWDRPQNVFTVHDFVLCCLVGEPEKVAKNKATESIAVNEAFAEQALILNISKISERI